MNGRSNGRQSGEGLRRDALSIGDFTLDATDSGVLLSTTRSESERPAEATGRVTPMRVVSRRAVGLSASRKKRQSNLAIPVGVAGKIGGTSSVVLCGVDFRPNSTNWVCFGDNGVKTCRVVSLEKR